jgi:hypothetical protein
MKTIQWKVVNAKQENKNTEKLHKQHANRLGKAQRKRENVGNAETIRNQKDVNI